VEMLLVLREKWLVFKSAGKKGFRAEPPKIDFLDTA